MKKLLFLTFLTTCVFDLKAQTFHFNNDTWTLNNTTAQSPAHWYLEIYNDIGVDTMLRWKAHFHDIPSQWVINFDDQTNSLPSIHDGDSADFVLQSGLTMPQKLIIGAMLNGTAAHGSIEFEIYDPNSPNDKDTIEFIFHITYSAVGLNTYSINNLYEINNEQLIWLGDGNVDFFVYDNLGRTINIEETDNKLFLPEFGHGEIYFVHIKSESEYHVIKLMQD